MAVDTATTIAGFDTAKPAGTDPKSEGDDNIRHVKSVLKTTFPNVAGAVTPTHTELNYVDGVTSAIQTQLDAKAALASPTFTGNPAAPTPSPGDNDTSIATTAFVATSFAPLASPTFTGVPAAPTASVGTNTTQLATTAFVIAESFVSALPSQTGNAGKYVTTDGSTASWGSLSAYATTAAVAASYAPLASPTLTGTPAAPTATAGTNTTQLATTAFVTGAVGAYVAGAVGTYAMCRDSSAPLAFGDTVAGSSLENAGINFPASVAASTAGGASLSGTWRCMGHLGGSTHDTTIFVRIS